MHSRYCCDIDMGAEMVGFEKILMEEETEHRRGSLRTIPRRLPFIFEAVGVVRDSTHTLDDISQFAFHIRFMYEKTDSEGFLFYSFLMLPRGSSPISAQKDGGTVGREPVDSSLCAL